MVLPGGGGDERWGGYPRFLFYASCTRTKTMSAELLKQHYVVFGRIGIKRKGGLSPDTFLSCASCTGTGSCQQRCCSVALPWTGAPQDRHSSLQVLRRQKPVRSERPPAVPATPPTNQSKSAYGSLLNKLPLCLQHPRASEGSS